MNRRTLLLSLLLLSAFLSNAPAQTFVDRQSTNSFRIVSYNVFQDDLFDNQNTAPGELTRFINAVDADVWNFQEAFDTSASEVRNLFNQIAPLEGGASWQAHKGRNQLIVSRHGLSLQDTDVPNGARGIAMAQVDLPDQYFNNDMYILNNHFPCCDSGEDGRRDEARAIVDWIGDAQTAGGNIDLESGTGIVVLGDLNTVNGSTPRDILLDGYNGKTTDWDGSSMTDSHPLHNADGPDDYTWRNDQSSFDPGRLDYVLYTDSVLENEYAYVLNPSTMSSADLAATGLQATDFMRDKDNPGNFNFDHLPLIVDFRANAVPEPSGLIVCVLGGCAIVVRRKRRNSNR
ncbi:MAG: endonuclease/exonuclease/phosphatase family protein [Mariniblastus sp.]